MFSFVVNNITIRFCNYHFPLGFVLILRICQMYQCMATPRLQKDFLEKASSVLVSMGIVYADHVAQVLMVVRDLKAVSNAHQVKRYNLCVYLFIFFSLLLTRD